MKIIKFYQCYSYFELDKEDMLRFDEVKKLGYNSITLNCKCCRNKTFLSVLDKFYDSWEEIPKEKQVEFKSEFEKIYKKYGKVFLNKSKKLVIADVKYTIFSSKKLKDIVLIGEKYVNLLLQSRLYFEIQKKSNFYFKENDIKFLENSIVIGESEESLLLLNIEDENNLIVIYNIEDGNLEYTKLQYPSLLDV